MARVDCPPLTSILFPIDESELKECNRIKFVYTAVGIISLQSSIFCAFISSFEEEQSGCILTFALNLTLI